MESFGFELKLADSIVAPARRMAEAVRSIATQAAKTQDVIGKQFEKIGFAAARAAKKQQDAFAMAWIKIATQSTKDARNASREQEKAAQAAARARDKATAHAAKATERASAKQAKEAERVRKEEEKQNKEIKRRSGYSLELQRAQEQLHKIKNDPKGYKALLKAQHDLSKEQEKLGKPSFQHQFVEGLTSRFSFGFLTSAAAAGTLLADGVMKVGGFLVSSAERFVGIIGDGFRAALREGGRAEHLRMSYRYLLGQKQGADTLSDIARFSGKTPYDDDRIAEMMAPLYQAGYKGQGARSAFALAGDIGAMSPTNSEGATQEAIDSLSRLRLRGEMNPRLLTALKIDQPTFYKTLGKKLGVDAKTAEKMASEGGKVNPNIALNTMMEMHEQQIGGKTGSALVAQSQMMESRIAKLVDLPNQFLKKASESSGWQKLSDKVGAILEQMDPDSANGKRIVDSLMDAFNRIADSLQRALTPENIDKLAKGMAAIVDLAGKFVSILGPLLDAAAKLSDAYSTGDEVRAAGGMTQFMANAPTYDQRSQEGNGFSFSEMFNGMFSSGNAEDIPGTFAYNQKHGLAPSQQTGKSIQINAPINVAVNANGDARAAQQTADLVADHIHSKLEQAAQHGGT